MLDDEVVFVGVGEYLLVEFGGVLGGVFDLFEVLLNGGVFGNFKGGEIGVVDDVGE